MLWQIEIYPADGQPDLEAQRIGNEAAELRIADPLVVHARRGYLIQGPSNEADVRRLADQLFTDRVVERSRVARDRGFGPRARRVARQRTSVGTRLVQSPASWIPFRRVLCELWPSTGFP